ncbi:hypothetical protein GLOIN_2v1790377 [Rhizophagus clarus]|uniref:Uncharacterized protein n=1 Tax=Rhizophagus clarus TaxID=94130 RepID=A0A8H3LEQ7_9GLOM|nr:hypothetical protein GLOIN_2v1790377 [Rhizophagus clarus]
MPEEEMKILPKVWYQRDGASDLLKQWYYEQIARICELDLLKRLYYALCNLSFSNGSADQRLSQPCRCFATMSSNFRNLLTNWYITEDKVSNEQESEKKMKKRCITIYNKIFPQLLM